MILMSIFQIYSVWLLSNFSQRFLFDQRHLAVNLSPIFKTQIQTPACWMCHNQNYSTNFPLNYPFLQQSLV